MANIKNELNNIKNAMYGKDVRNSIHDGIEAINKEVESTTGRQIDLDSAFNQLIINAGNSNAEIVDARVKADGTSYSKLGDRLNEVDSQLAQSMNNIDDKLDSKVSKNTICVNITDFGAQNTPNFDSTEAIQGAIDYLSNLGGGVVVIPPGLWRTSSTITLKHNVSLIGSGRQASRLQIFSHGTGNVIELEAKDWKTTGTYQRIESLTIDGNKSGKTDETHGIYCPSSVMYTYINDVEVRNCSGDGIKYVTSHRNILKNIITENNNGNGITISSSSVEGTGTETDNHVEMGYITSCGNGKNGYNFLNPIDIRCIHLGSMANGENGFYIKNAGGGWCNVLDTLSSQGDGANGVFIEGGNSLTINNLNVSTAGEYGFKVSDHKEGKFNNLKIFNNTTGSIYLHKLELSDMNNVISKMTDNEVVNFDMTLSRFSNYSNIQIVGGLKGLFLRNYSSENNITNIQIRDTKSYGIHLEGTASSLITGNGFNNVLMRRVKQEDGEGTSNFYLRYAPNTTINNFRISEDRTTIYTDYAIDISTSENCLISNSIGYGNVAGFRKHEDNKTSIISDVNIQGIYS